MNSGSAVMGFYDELGSNPWRKSLRSGSKQNMKGI